jgi:hypothetical protein
MKGERPAKLIIHVERQLNNQQDAGPKCLVEEARKEYCADPILLDLG